MKAHCLPFSQIPHTTRLFLDLLAYSPKVQPFYPQSPHFREWFREQAGSLSYDSSRRERVSAILERQNKSWNASPQTLANLDRLRKGASAVVTGQQVGLFGGPMFAIYKALTAVRLAEEATSAGVDCVPIFWLATYDHDLAEVNHVSLPGADGLLKTFSTTSHDKPGAPVSAVHLGDDILPTLDEVATLLGETEATSLLRETYRPGTTLGAAFAQLYARLFAEWGVIVLDASDGELHRVAEPVYRGAVERSDELASALLAQGAALEAAGYHQQVKVTQSSVLLFTLKDGVRTPIHHTNLKADEEFSIGPDAGSERISRAELLSRVGATTEEFSPNVLLRPIVQDYLLPTLAYTGGAAEAAYFAQAAAVYKILLGRVTPIVPRFSATIVEPKMQRLMDKHGISVTDVFGDPKELKEQISAKSLPADLQAAFEKAKKSFDADLQTVKEKLEKLDKTLVDAAETARSKMQYQLERLYSQAARAEAQKGELVGRHAEILSDALYPEKGLQERGIGGIHYVARYGREFLQQLHDTIQTDCHDHQVLAL